MGNGIFTERELQARWEIRHESYAKDIQIESRSLADLAGNHIIPTAICYQNILVENVKGLKEILSGEKFKRQSELQIYIIEKISEHISSIRQFVKEMIEQRKAANMIEEAHLRSEFYCENVKPYLDKVRYHADKLEVLIDDEMWTLPKYRELLFVK